MNYRVFAPPLPLKDLVQCFWSLESVKHAPTPAEYFLMADSCLEIIFQYNGGLQGYSTQSVRIRFQHSTHDKFRVGNEVGFFGVRLYPHAVSELLHIPASELVNRVFDFTSFFKQDGRDMTDQVFNSGNSHDRVALVSDFLIKRSAAKKADPIKALVNQVLYHEGQINISHLHQQSGLSVKQFERRFKASAGFPPKYFSRLVRFQATKRKYSSDQIQSLTDLAYACNYFDQSHFIREFKEFSGVQPLHYFNSMTQRQSNSRVSGAMKHQYDGFLPCGWFV